MKKFLFLAFISAMFLLSCTSDGYFYGDPSSANWGKEQSVPCLYANGICANLQASICSAAGGTVVSTCSISSSSNDTPSSNSQSSIPTTTASKYCFEHWGDDCDIIGSGYFVSSEAVCISYGGRVLENRESCLDYTTEDNIYDD